MKVFISTTFTHTHTHALALHFAGKLLYAKGCERERESFLRPALAVMNVFNLQCCCFCCRCRCSSCCFSSREHIAGNVVVAMFACCQINAFDTSAISTYTQFTYSTHPTGRWGIYSYSMNNFTAYNLFIKYTFLWNYFRMHIAYINF